MRAGRLDTPATLLRLDEDLNPVEIDWIYCGVQTREEGELPAALSLRNPAKVSIRAWYDDRIRQGLYLRTDARLLHIDSARDFDGRQFELAITATELVGECGQALINGLPPRACRVFLQHGAPVLDELGRATEYMTRAEVALIEAGRLQAGQDQLRVCGVLYNIIDYDDRSDDGIVRGLWLQPVA